MLELVSSWLNYENINRKLSRIFIQPRGRMIMPIRTGQEYIDSLRGRKLKIFLFGEEVKDPVEHDCG